jgi:hypothetical protein
MNSMDEITEVLELFPGTPYAKKVRCKLCGEIVFDVKDDCKQSEIDAEMVRLSAHMAIQHEIHVEHHKCDDLNCVD